MNHNGLSFLLYWLCFISCFVLDASANSVVENIPPRIVGGSPAAVGEFPYQCFIEGLMPDGAPMNCGCSLLSSNWAVTAAHCTAGIKDRNLRLWFGMVDRTKFNCFNSFSVHTVYQHPEYNAIQNLHDISLMRLDEEIIMNENVSSIALPTNDESANVNQSCSITGWGLFEEGESLPRIMQKAMVPIRSNEECRILYQNVTNIEPEHVCAGYENGGIDSCQGDSGGPLACLSSTGKPVLQGITSFGAPCARPAFPGVYTRVSSYVDWIAETIENEASVLRVNSGYVVVLLLTIIFHNFQE